MLVLFLDTGLRCGELRSLLLTNVNLEGGYLKVLGEGWQGADFTIWHGGAKSAAALPVAFSAATGELRHRHTVSHCGWAGALQELHERNLRGARPQFRRKTAAPASLPSHFCDKLPD